MSLVGPRVRVGWERQPDIARVLLHPAGKQLPRACRADGHLDWVQLNKTEPGGRQDCRACQSL